MNQQKKLWQMAEQIQIMEPADRTMSPRENGPSDDIRKIDPTQPAVLRMHGLQPSPMARA
jgi:hypothetical protein